MSAQATHPSVGDVLIYRGKRIGTAGRTEERLC
jgi:hypothetical protein